MTDPILTTVADVVAGRYPHGAIVTITGQLNMPTWKRSLQGNPWGSFYLIKWPTSVQINLHPTEYEKFGDGMGPILADYRPQDLTITGRITSGNYAQPAVTVTDVRRHTDLPCDSLKKIRRSDERLRAKSRASQEQKDADEAPLPKPGDGVPLEDVLKRLKGADR